MFKYVNIYMNNMYIHTYYIYIYTKKLHLLLYFLSINVNSNYTYFNALFAFHLLTIS